ncbi:MAG: mycothiol system anti-sigma-R factor [Candidatus Nanopelagicales bacterium]
MTFESTPEQLNPESGSAQAAQAGCPCSEANEHVWNYLDGELSEQDCSRIKEHLAVCKECRDQYESEQSLKEAVSRSCGCDEVPITLRAEISVLVARLRNQSCN